MTDAAIPDDARRIPKVAYLLKVYPRFSQTFVLNEILAHQAAQHPVEIFSLRRPNDGRFHPALSRVDASVQYFDELPANADALLNRLHQVGEVVPNVWDVVEGERETPAAVIYQAACVARAVLENKIQHIHAHFGNVATSVARLATQMCGITYSFTAHARDIYRDNVDDEDMRRKIMDAAGVVTVSQYNVDHFRRTYGELGEKVELVYNGLSLEEFPLSERRSQKNHLVAVGRFVEKKGFRDLIDACDLLRQNGFEDSQCTVVGDGPLRTELENRIASKNLQHCVRLAGALPADDVKRIIAGSAVLVAPCIVAADGDRDGLPTVLLESMALGTPSVSTPVTGIPEAIRHNETGLLAACNDPQSLATACAKLLRDRDFANEISANARALVEAQFDVRRNSATLRQLFRQWAIGDGKRSPQ